MAIPPTPRRFPLLGKTVSLAAVLVALTLAWPR